jgi:DNA-binding NarL/FixJ family response regulator
VLALLDSGSDGRAYLLKERVHDRGELVGAIEAVAAGGSVIDPKIVEVLVAARTRAANTALDDLADRERAAKLGLVDSAEVSRRVKAALLCLAEGRDASA